MMGDAMRSLSSRHHPLVATCRALARARVGDDARLLLDGAHLVAEALAAGLQLETVAFTARARSTHQSPHGASSSTHLRQSCPPHLSTSNVATSRLWTWRKRPSAPEWASTLAIPK